MRTLAIRQCLFVSSVMLNVMLVAVFIRSRMHAIQSKQNRSYSARKTVADEDLSQHSTGDAIAKTAASETVNVVEVPIRERPAIQLPVKRVCSEDDSRLLGKFDINLTLAEWNYWNESGFGIADEITEDSKSLGSSIPVQDLQKNKLFTSPEDCFPSYSVAFIIPFRDRESHLRILLGVLVPILRRQLIGYSIFVVEQVGNDTFNKGRLMNTAFEFAAKVGKRIDISYDCFIFHDVDLLSEDDSLLYRCSEGNEVTHLSTTIDKYNYHRMCCGITVGGVLAMREEQFRKVNGFATTYWGWGGEDDDMNRRIREGKINVARPAAPKGRFRMIPHTEDRKNPPNKNRHRRLSQAVKKMEEDGLNTLSTNITRTEKYPLFVKLLVEVGKPP